MRKIIVGVFDDFAAAENTVQDLVDNGFPREDISLVVNDAEGKYSRYARVDEGGDVVAGASTGAAVGGVFGLLVGLGSLTVPGIGPVLAAGPLATTIAGATVGAATGLWLGGLDEEANVPQEEAMLYSEAVRRGATLVSVHAEESVAGRAREIIQRHRPIDLSQRAAQWRQSEQTDSSVG